MITLSKKVKFGVYLPEELTRELEDFMRHFEAKSKSKLIQEALRLYIVEHKWKHVKGSIAGVISVIYDHEVAHADEVLTDIQHEFLDVIVSTLHVHLDVNNCMLAIAVKGASNKIRELISRVGKVKGVKLVRPMLMASE